jgi:hypothetical protein
MQTDNKCPYHVGDEVLYTPSQKGMGLSANDSPEHKLVAGKAYTIESIQKESYVVVVGYSHPGGGLYWTEFTKREGT